MDDRTQAARCPERRENSSPLSTPQNRNREKGIHEMDFMTMAQAAGEQGFESPEFVLGDDFDPSDYDEVEIVAEASARHRGDRLTQLEDENADLRARLAEATGRDD
ncbi:hypothetical protein [Rhodococcus qingshengii]|uniref:hypothetical protein n=1 Tax=Rhodococcus qingshengii TaxID=334542 RepID=UPI00301B1238